MMWPVVPEGRSFFEPAAETVGIKIDVKVFHAEPEAVGRVQGTYCEIAFNVFSFTVVASTSSRLRSHVDRLPNSRLDSRRSLMDEPSAKASAATLLTAPCQAEQSSSPAKRRVPVRHRRRSVQVESRGRPRGGSPRVAPNLASRYSPS